MRLSGQCQAAVSSRRNDSREKTVQIALRLKVLSLSSPNQVSLRFSYFTAIFCMSGGNPAGAWQYRRRRMTPDDVEGVVDLYTREYPFPPELERDLSQILRDFLCEQLVRAGVVERLRKPGGEWELAAFGLGCFLGDTFCKNYFSKPFPFLAVHVLDALQRGRAEEVLLPAEELHRRQKEPPARLNLLIPAWVQDNYDLEAEDTWQLLYEGYALLESYMNGLRLHSVIVEGRKVHAPLFEAAGFARIIDMEDRAADSPFAMLTRDVRYRPLIHGVHTVEDFRKRPAGTPVGKMFMFREPVLDLSDGQKEVLELALEGYNDSEIAGLLSITNNAVRMRWRGIYEKIQLVLPDVLPADDGGEGGARGYEKRRQALNYIREHPEEIRPWMRMPFK